MAKEQLLVFLKAPRPGQVKTRLAAEVGSERAAEIYRQLVATLLANLAPLKAVELRYSPDEAQAEIAPWVAAGWSAVAQGSGDLGERLHRAFAESFARGAERVVIVGSDCPEVASRDIRTAWKELAQHEVVVGPAVDGGYWLIGLRQPQPELFTDIAWSSDQVLGQTLQKARKLNLRIQLLRILQDVDTKEDWDAYVRQNPNAGAGFPVRKK